MTPKAFWVSVITASVALVTCLLVFEVSMASAVGWAGAVLILPALIFHSTPPTEEELARGDR